MERPNLYRLYEENIGPLTPLVADALRDAENTYAIEWIEEAIRIAVQEQRAPLEVCGRHLTILAKGRTPWHESTKRSTR
jgi:hypothetical protein